MKEIFYLFPLVGALAGFTTAFLGALLVHFLFKEKEISPLLDEQLDELVLTFKQEIPMAAMFLKGKMVENLKNRAGEKLLGLVPKIKTKFFKKFAWKWLLLGTVTGLVIGLLLNLLILNI